MLLNLDGCTRLFKLLLDLFGLFLLQAFLHQLRRRLDQVLQRPSEAVKLPDHQGIALPKRPKTGGQLGAVTFGDFRADEAGEAGIGRAGGQTDDCRIIGSMRVFFDGRDPEVNGEPFVLPRRERRILEYLVRNQNKRVTKEKIFGFVYGFCNEEVEESVIESHISKLRKKLRARLGFDPIDSKRYVGYMLENG